MKTIIAGSRTITDMVHLEDALDACGFAQDITEVVSGAARGVDELGEKWAENKGIPVKKFPADWDLHGRSAGYYRNSDMGDYADAAIIVWDGKSKGSQHMLHIAQRKGLRVHMHKVSVK